MSKAYRAESGRDGRPMLYFGTADNRHSVAEFHGTEERDKAVLALNRYDALVSALESVLRHYEITGDHCHAGGAYPGDCVACNARIVLAEAKGEQEPTPADLQKAEFAALQSYARRQTNLKRKA